MKLLLVCHWLILIFPCAVDLPEHTLLTHTVLPSVLAAQSAFTTQSITITGAACKIGEENEIGIVYHYLILIFPCAIDLPEHILLTHTVLPSVLAAQSAFTMQSITITGAACENG